MIKHCGNRIPHEEHKLLGHIVETTCLGTTEGGKAVLAKYDNLRPSGWGSQ